MGWRGRTASHRTHLTIVVECPRRVVTALGRTTQPAPAPAGRSPMVSPHAFMSARRLLSTAGCVPKREPGIGSRELRHCIRGSARSSLRTLLVARGPLRRTKPRRARRALRRATWRNRAQHGATLCGTNPPQYGGSGLPNSNVSKRTAQTSSMCPNVPKCAVRSRTRRRGTNPIPRTAHKSTTFS